MNDIEHKTIVFFDGYCGLCSGVVDFLISRDVNRKLTYSPLQGETAQMILSERQRSDLDTIVVVARDEKTGATKHLEKSDAVLEALAQVGSIWTAVSILARIFPRSFRNIIYDLVAKNRFKIFGRRESCRLPSPEERKLFLP